MALPQPVILTDASLKISKDQTTANLTELACLANHIELSPDTTLTTLDTMCGTRDYPGSVKWTLVATLYQSFDPLGTEEVLSGAVAAGAPIPFEVVPYKGRLGGATNPRYSGTLIPQDYSPINGDAGDASTVELEWSLVQAPTKNVTTQAKSTTATAGTPGAFTPAGSAVPNLAAMSAAPAVTASPATAWTTGQYVATLDGLYCSWNGTAWVAGARP